MQQSHQTKSYICLYHMIFFAWHQISSYLIVCWHFSPQKLILSPDKAGTCLFRQLWSFWHSCHQQILTECLTMMDNEYPNVWELHTQKLKKNDTFYHCVQFKIFKPSIVSHLIDRRKLIDNIKLYTFMGIIFSTMITTDAIAWKIWASRHRK